MVELKKIRKKPVEVEAFELLQYKERLGEH